MQETAGEQTAEGFQTYVNSRTDNVKHPIAPLSDAVKQVLEESGETEDEIAAKPFLNIPETPGNHPLAEYYISSSHNTYLLSRQIFGKSSAESYSHVLKHGARCVEIDVWPHPSSKNDQTAEPIVTHGYTFSKSVGFRDVCKAINDGVNANDWPVLVSLECHVPESGQKQLVDIIREEWGTKIVDTPIKDLEGRQVTPDDLKGRILLIVEYYPPTTTEETEDLTSSDEEEEEYSDSPEAQALRSIKLGRSWKEKRTISPELATLGVYTQSMKPKAGWLTQTLDPELHIMINISESAMSKLLPTSLAALIDNGKLTLRRIYPKGTRISSANLNPLKFWRCASQIACLNWQHYDHGVQLNEAMFVGSPGYVLKGETVRRISEDVASDTATLTCRVVGVSGLTPPDGDSSFKSRLVVTLYHSSGEQTWKSKTVHTKPDSKDAAHPFWDEQFSMTYANEDLVFIKFCVENEGLIESTPLALCCARASHIAQGWRLARLLDRSGKHSGATLLLMVTIQ